jgi:two-component system KDP operon response regulator KdpE
MSPRVLIVDDEHVLLRLLEVNLRAVGFDVRTAASGREALDAAAAEAPDAVVLDLGLPDLGGEEVLVALRQIPGMAAVPVIVLSGSDPHAASGYASGMFAHLTKPVDPAVVVETVRRALAAAG